MPPPGIVEDSAPAQVTTRPLTPRKVNEGDGSFGDAVAATASQTNGMPPLRSAVGILSLAAALAALVAIWWQTLGARLWGVRRRKAQPRRMIDIAIAEKPELTFDRGAAWSDPASSRLGDRAAAE